ncbi:major facilitator superfamily domain-containing protein [Boletus reticuloceps]|uniref:Major facilitator superfamily domain-containing protein n=1 Tax=Boletus reticuloceps TaxID=495285 RepID=A0A8I2YZY7_9AGAM|nr:major facilitator superfamily domain-containing protein [Boletus reticuloceps]
MDLLQSQSQAQVQRDGFGQGKSNDEAVKGVHAVTSRYFSSNLSSSECRTLHDENGTSRDQDSEKDALKLTGKYAKYAGDPPDGGLKAWSVILACVRYRFLHSVLGTYRNDRGLCVQDRFDDIFQAYYEEVILSNESPSDIAWIGSVQYALVFLPGLVTGRLFDIGYFKMPYFFASCLLVACTFLVAECKVYWQFLLAQGLGIGLASGILFGPALGIVSHWFSKRRGLALGVTAIGSSVGGTVFPIAAQKLIPEVGHVQNYLHP